MAVEAKHVSRKASPDAWRRDDFDDPTEDLSRAVREEHAAAPAAPAQAAVDEDPFAPGNVLGGRYELERVVGRGGFSLVLAAFDLRRRAAGDADPRVAIKVLRPELRRDPDARERLTAEFRQLQQLSHPGIVRVYDLDRHGEDWFLVMELLDGLSLAGLLRQDGGDRLPAGQALGIVRDCAEALGWAHGRGTVHGDIKPGNVFVTSRDGMRLLDFGAASAAQATTSTAGERSGQFATPAYASPQVLQGRLPEARDDVYSLACVAFEMLAGSHPFGRVDSREAWARGVPVADTPGLDPGLRAGLVAGLAFDRDRRPATMADFVQGLDARNPATAPAAAHRGPGRIGLWVALAALAAVVVAAAALLYRDAVPVARTEAPPATAATASPGGSADAAVDVPGARVVEPAEDAVTGAVVAEPTVEQRSAGPASPPAPAPERVAQRQRVAFAGESVIASRTAPAAAIPVRRSGGSDGRAVIVWRIDEGSARAGRDFAGPLSGTLVLADGQQGGTVFVPLLGGVQAAEDRRFGVRIDAVRGPARAVGATRVEVTIRSFVADPARR